MDHATRQPSGRVRWLALIVLCVGNLMIVVDTTVVNVALPSIRADLGLSTSALAWVVNAYMLTFGGFLLLAGRLGDLLGRSRVFLGGIVLFTAASMLCGVATTRITLVIARAVQGTGAATVAAVAFSLMVSLFANPSERAHAMGVFGFVSAGGASLGVLIGGVLTDLAGWHSIFLINLPVGLAVLLAGRRWLPPSPATHQRKTGLDVVGAVALTTTMICLTYAIVGTHSAGWQSAQTLGLLCVSGVLGAGFVAWERRAPGALLPPSVFRYRNLWVSNLVGVAWAACVSTLFFLSALYLELVLGFSPLQVGLAFLPSNLAMMAISLTVSARLVVRLGLRPPLVAGLVLAALGLGWLSVTPVHDSLLTYVEPALVLIGIGAGLIFNPLLLAVMHQIDSSDTGVASGVTSTGLALGGALGLATLASVASARSRALAAHGRGPLAALTGGYHLAFASSAVLAFAAAIVAAACLPARATVTDTDTAPSLTAA